jgi:acetyl-CoA carboxylase carboxyl transferase subunit beta
MSKTEPKTNGTPANGAHGNGHSAARPAKKKDIPEQVWMKCPGCGETVFRKLVEERLMVCPECQYHHTLSARRRIEVLADPGTFVERHAGLAPTDPLGFKDLVSYADRLKKYQNATGLKDAAICGTAAIEGRPVALCVMEPGFLMASMGSVVGEKVTRSIEDALELRRPLVIVCASGGARMMEGVISLMQMAKTSAALARLDSAGGFYIAVLTNPTTAGVMASFASLGDIIIAEPKAMIGFTGPRVIKETIRAELPAGFQTAEFLLEHGFLDRVVPRGEMRNEIGRLLAYWRPSGPTLPSAASAPMEAPA